MKNVSSSITLSVKKEQNSILFIKKCVVVEKVSSLFYFTYKLTKKQSSFLFSIAYNLKATKEKSI